MANPTVAKDIALYFFKKKNWKITPSLIAITIKQAKTLLDAGFTEKEIKMGIDYYIKYPPKDGLKSLGYLNVALNYALEQIKQKQELIKAQKLNEINIGNVGGDIEHGNKAKFARSDAQSRFGKRYNFDLFEKSRENN